MTKRRLVGATAGAGATLAILIWARFGPFPEELLQNAGAASVVVVDRHGAPLYEARSRAGTRRATLSAQELPSVLADATLAAEDRRFYWHPGVDPVALVRAAWQNMRAGRVVEGGSTVTQQVAKMLLARDPGPGARRRGWRAKLKEAVVALRLERRLTKQEILAQYLNLAPYGNQIEGAGRAAEIYFGVDAAMLTAAQAAFLAALPQRPSAYNPYRSVESARRRQHAIIARMLDQGRISAEGAGVARAESLRFLPLPAEFRAPHFVEMVLAKASTADRIETTLDAALQEDVEGIIRSQRATLARHGAHNLAVVVLDNRTSEWLAWEGSGNYSDAAHGGTINGPLALRQPGSALKPFTYALAFETGDTPATVLADVPSTFPTAEDGVVYRPVNYDGDYHGPLRARKALAGSQNVPAVALAAKVGVPDLHRLLRRVGIASLDRTAAHYGLGLTLGNAEVRLADLVAAYAAFARGGVWMAPRAFGSEPRAPAQRVISQRAAFWVTDILSDADARAYVFGRGGSLEFPFPVAVKTGTSQAYRDNWTIGYTREVTVGVWVGNFDRSPLVGSSGVTGAGPVFHAVMLAAHQRASALLDGLAAAPSAAVEDAIVARPAGLQEQAICELSGMAAGPACAARRIEWLPNGAPAVPCDWHHQSDEGPLTIWPSEYEPWARARGLIGIPVAPVTASGPEAQPARVPQPARARVLDIVSPPAGATYLIDPTLRAEFQTVPFRAVAAVGDVEWLVNGQQVGIVAGTRDLHWPLRPGTHRVVARDARGRSAKAQITVR